MLFGIIRSKETSIHIIIYKYLLFIFDIIYLYLFQFEHVGFINPCFLHSLRPPPLHFRTFLSILVHMFNSYVLVNFPYQE